MKESKRKLTQALGQFVDEGRETYNLVYQTQIREGVDLSYEKIQIKENKEWYWDGTYFKTDPRIYDFLIQGIFLKNPKEIINFQGYHWMSAIRNQIFRPMVIEDESLSLIFASGEKHQEVSVNSFKELFSDSKINHGLKMEGLSEEVLGEIKRTGFFAIRLKITTSSPAREVLRNFFNPNFYVPRMMDPHTLFESITLMDVKLERLKLYGVNMPAKEATSDKIYDTLTELKWSHFGVKDVLSLEKVVEAFPKPIKNDQLFQEFPTWDAEAGVMVRWNQIIQGLIRSKRPLPVLR